MQTVHIGAVIECGPDLAVGPDQYGGQCLLVGCCGDDVDALTPAVGDPAQRWAVGEAVQQVASGAGQRVDVCAIEFEIGCMWAASPASRTRPRR